jgi:hypothetical protein
MERAALRSDSRVLTDDGRSFSAQAALLPATPIRQAYPVTRPSRELAVDHHLSAVATLTCTWAMSSARDLAWHNARLLWAVRDDPLARGLFLDSLAASAVMASRMLLVAV